MFLRLALILLAFSLSLAADRPHWHYSDGDVRGLSQPCGHYAQRAKSTAMGGNAEFIADMADGCVSALASLREGGPGERMAAAAFLIRLGRLQDLITDMGLVRDFGDGDRSGPAAHQADVFPTGVDSRHVAGKVSAVGEYLIAHQIGLLAAYNTWLDNAPTVAMALRRER